MLKSKKHQFTARSIQEIAPWAAMVTPELILNKDGSLLSVFDFAGVDADTPHKAQLSVVRNQLDHACKNFDHRITAWWRMSHRRAKVELPSTFTSPIDARLDEINQRQTTSGKFFRNALSLALAYTPETGLSKFFEKVGYHMSVGGKAVPVAVFEAGRDQILGRRAFMFDLEKIRSDIKRFESVLDAFKGGVTALGLSRRTMQDAFVPLHQAANPGVPARRIRYPVTMLDSHLTETTIEIGANTLMFESAYGRRYARIIGIKEWMGFQEAALDVLGQVNAELDVCIMFRFLDRSRASSHIKKMRSFYKMAAFNPWAMIKQIVAKEEQKNDQAREKLSEEADAALTRLVADGSQFGFANISVVVYGDTLLEVETATTEVIGLIGNAGFGALLETDNLFASWATTLPGRWDQQRRLQFVETPSMSDVALLTNVPDGPSVNVWLTEQSGQATGALTVLPTQHKTLQQIILQDPSGSGHILLVGPIGAGKSVFLNFILSQTGRHNARRIKFDKDRSTRIPTVLAGGRFIDVTGKFEAATPINPLSLLRDKANFTYVAEWVQLAIEDEQFTCTKEHERKIYEAVTTLGEGYGPDQWTLSKLNALLPAELREQLSVWTEGEKYGHFFDHAEDAFELSDDLAIEMGTLFQNFPVAAGLFIDYAFYRIDQILDGKRFVVIEIEEGGFFFEYPKFYKRLELWTVTIRKRNGLIVIATQSLKQLERIKNFEVLKENIRNIIYLPNPGARSQKALYSDVFGLTDDQIEVVSDAVRNRDYLWVTADQARLFQAHFPKDALSILRADGRAQDVFDRHLKSGAADWRENYLNEISNLN